MTRNERRVVESVLMSDQPAQTAEPFDGLRELAVTTRMRRGRVARGEANLEAASAELPKDQVIAPFQFRLRTMLVVVAAASGLLALMQIIGAVWSSILVWFLLLVAVHVTANVWGTRVAPRASRAPGEAAVPAFPLQDERRPSPVSGGVRLRESCRPGWPMLVATGIGTLVGGGLGSVALVLLSLESAGYCGVILGSFSAAAVGGFLGFLASSFAEVAFRAWKEALETASPRRPPPD